MRSGDIGTVPRAGVLAGWVSAVAAKFARRARLKNTSRAEFEQIARDLELSFPQLYGLLTGRALSADVVEMRLTDMDLALEPIGTRRVTQDSEGPLFERPRLTVEMREWLMFGPFCC